MNLQARSPAVGAPCGIWRWDDLARVLSSNIVDAAAGQSSDAPSAGELGPDWWGR